MQRHYEGWEGNRKSGLSNFRAEGSIFGFVAEGG